jgi:hypothetical protein
MQNCVGAFLIRGASDRRKSERGRMRIRCKSGRGDLGAD